MLTLVAFYLESSSKQYSHYGWDIFRYDWDIAIFSSNKLSVGSSTNVLQEIISDYYYGKFRSVREVSNEVSEDATMKKQR